MNKNLDYQLIIETVTSVFTGCDDRNWQEVKEVFASTVLLDYSSLSGNPATTLASDDIINAWKPVFSGFAATHHQVGNFKVQQNGQHATVFCYGTATHYLPNDSGKNFWIVAGTYNFHLIQDKKRWKIDRMKFNFRFQDGNHELPKLAAEKTTQ